MLRPRDKWMQMLLKNKGWIFQALIAFCVGYVIGFLIFAEIIDPAIIIALLALFFAVYQFKEVQLFTQHQFKEVQRHHRLTVKPLMETRLLSFLGTSSADGKYSLVYEIVNCGLGPAIVSNFNITHNGKNISTKDIFFIAAASSQLPDLLQKEMVKRTFVIHTMCNNSFYIKENSKIEIIDIKFWSVDESISNSTLGVIHEEILTVLFNEIVINYEYTSIYCDDKVTVIGANVAKE